MALLRPVLLAGLALALLNHSPPASAQRLVGVVATPHQFSPHLQWRRPPNPELAARVELLVLNDGDEPLAWSRATPPRFDGALPSELLASDAWAWHDTPECWLDEPPPLPPGALSVLQFNGKSAKWGIPTAHEVKLTPESAALPFRLEAPQTWLSAVTFLAVDEHGEPSASPFPNELVVHIASAPGAPGLKVESCRLWLPRRGESHHVLWPAVELTELKEFGPHRLTGSGFRYGFTVRCDPLPLAYAAVEVRTTDAQGAPVSLWGYLKIKRETFDISGGWVASSRAGGGSTLADERYLKTLKRMHVNTGQIEEVDGYTDDPALMRRYPLKRFNRLGDFARYDTDAMLPTIHAVEFLGEPQYGGGRPVPPQEVWQELAPYQPTRLPTSVTLSEEHAWRYYAGLSDYPHYDAYRVIAPAADLWSKYDRWEGQSIRWGAPLETIGDMTRSLREQSRPKPIAYWSQGAHHDWGSRFNPRRGSPTPDELRSQAWHALGHRVTSLYWFNLSVKSLVKFPDLIEPMTRVGREIRAIEPVLLAGDAIHYERKYRDGKPDLDVMMVASPSAVLIVLHDLTYRADPEKREFVFAPRAAEATITLPDWLPAEAKTFRLDAEGTYDADVTRQGLRDLTFRDTFNVVGIYLASGDASLRERVTQRLQALRAEEEALGFDPGGNPDDLAELRALIEE